MKNPTFFLSASSPHPHPHILKQITHHPHQIPTLPYPYKNYTHLQHTQINQDLLPPQNSFQNLPLHHIQLLTPPTRQFNQKPFKIATQY
ncbi:polysaccharide deacetylase family protein, partial [Bacillus pumilus]|uniref:polysaccharide deacetylase family protein n=1 Tax=Bacillus pumilus TaxID=1408 RepID=UPI003703ADE8